MISVELGIGIIAGFALGVVAADQIRERLFSRHYHVILFDSLDEILEEIEQVEPDSSTKEQQLISAGMMRAFDIVMENVREERGFE